MVRGRKSSRVSARIYLVNDQQYVDKTEKYGGPERTCAACDCKLDSDSIKVKLRGDVVEVCCIECAKKLNEAQDSTVERVAS